MQKKELYLGKRIEDLEQHFTINMNMLKGKAVPSLVLSLKRMVEKADHCRIEGDEEMSYVLFMKFMNILNEIKKLPDFMKEKNLIVKMLGNNIVITKHFDKIEVLQKSLIERYSIAYPVSVKIAEPIGIDETPDVLRNTSTSEVRELIDCKALFDMMNDGEKLLIMDCRPEPDYEQSKMTYKYTVNVPEQLLALGMTASKINEKLPNDSKVFWQLREKRPLIVFVDWSSKRYNRNSPVWHLKEILMEWDQEVEKKPEMLLLEGGYEKWKTLYPMKCLNPQYSLPNESNEDVPAIEDVEYPNWEDIKMKDESLNRSSTPQVDRSMKMNAMKAHETNKTQIELLVENEVLMDKSLKNEKELLGLESDLKQIVSNKENTEDSSAQEQQYMFKIWELQAKQNDFNVEEKAIKQQLDHNKTLVNEPQEMTKVMELELQIEQMEREKQRVHEERENKKKEREEALKFARNRKPTFNDHKTQPKSRKEELILSPKALTNQVNVPSIPSFDRSAKPLQTYNRQIYNVEDFSPVYGRVVS